MPLLCFKSLQCLPIILREKAYSGLDPLPLISPWDSPHTPVIPLNTASSFRAIAGATPALRRALPDKKGPPL
jgi:hypothetical protein